MGKGHRPFVTTLLLRRHRVSPRNKLANVYDMTTASSILYKVSHATKFLANFLSSAQMPTTERELDAILRVYSSVSMVIDLVFALFLRCHRVSAQQLAIVYDDNCTSLPL